MGVSELEATRMADLGSMSWLAEGEDQAARQFSALVDRLSADLDAHPDSPTLRSLAMRHRVTGDIIGTAAPTSLLGLAYVAGAPARLIIEAEHVDSLTAGHGHLRRAVRLDATRRDLNRRLRPYLGRNALATVTVRLPLAYPARADVTLPDVLDAPKWTEAVQLALTADADPPPLEDPDLVPVLRTGPPSARVSVAA